MNDIVFGIRTPEVVFEDDLYSGNEALSSKDSMCMKRQFSVQRSQVQQCRVL